LAMPVPFDKLSLKAFKNSWIVFFAEMALQK
jgi:hypothetical protein